MRKQFAKGHLSAGPAGKRFRTLITRGLIALCLLSPGLSVGQEVTVMASSQTNITTAGSNVTLTLFFLNQAGAPVNYAVPSQLPLRMSIRAQYTNLMARAISEPSQATIPAGGFVRQDYALRLPEGMFGPAMLEFLVAGGNAVPLNIQPAPEPPITHAGIAGFFEEKLRPEKNFSPVDFFKEHVFGYEPMYFIAGPNPPEGKFQFSLRYQLFSAERPPAQNHPWLKGFNFAYTQTSLWDLGQLSSPFVDTSYKPELFYYWQRADGGRWGDRFRLDLQGGVQHESNGNPEIDSRLLDVGERVSYYVQNGSGSLHFATSRSLNIIYLRPTITFGRTNELQFSLLPRVWGYVGGLEDNPDLPYYRGYADLRAIVGWDNSLQLSALGRLGGHFNRGSVQLDLTYPLMKVVGLNIYLMGQYFNGYGESLLLYKHHSDTLRFGFSIYR